VAFIYRASISRVERVSWLVGWYLGIWVSKWSLVETFDAARRERKLEDLEGQYAWCEAKNLGY